MLPSVRGVAVTRWQIFLYTLSLLPPIFALAMFAEVGMLFNVISVLSTAAFIWYAWKLLVTKDDTKAMPLFHYSCLYLFLVFGGLVVDQIVGFFWT